MREEYDLEEGKLLCRCLIRRWKFCGRMKDLAGGKVTPNLLRCSEGGRKKRKKNAENVTKEGKCLEEEAGRKLEREWNQVKERGRGGMLWEKLVCDKM